MNITPFILTVMAVVGFTATARAQLDPLSFSVPSPVVAGFPGDHRGSATAVGDFNGDGFDDLAIGVPDFQEGSQVGLVCFFLGEPSGFGLGNFIGTLSFGLGFQKGMRFGAALAVGDFNGDGFDDLAIGIPGRLIDGDDNAGAVGVVYGNGNSFDFDSTQVFSQGPLAGAVEAGDAFGYSLAAGDLDQDGIDDLAIGVPREDVLTNNGFGVRTDAGAVNVVYGVLGAGLSTTGNIVLHQDVPGVALNVNDDDRFGFSLAIGDFTGDLQPDLAVGVPGEFRGGSDGAGAVEIFESGPDGLDVTLTEQIFSQLDNNIQGTPDDDDEFGFSLVAGDFDGNSRTDLAVGVPGEAEFLGFNEIGAVQVFYGVPNGLSTASDDVFDESSGGGPYFPAAFNRFGEALAAGDFDADGRADLVIGAPLSDWANVVNSGSATIYYGAAGGLTATGDQILNLDILGASAPGNRFAFALATGRFDDRTDGGDDLVVGVPGLPFDGDQDRGIVIVFQSVFPFVDGFETDDTSRWDVQVP